MQGWPEPCIHGVYTVFSAGKPPNIHCFAVNIYGSGQPYVFMVSYTDWGNTAPSVIIPCICYMFVWPEPCIYTVYDRIFGDFPAKKFVHTRYIYGSGQPWLYVVPQYTTILYSLPHSSTDKLADKKHNTHTTHIHTHTHLAALTTTTISSIAGARFHCSLIRHGSILPHSKRGHPSSAALPSNANLRSHFSRQCHNLFSNLQPRCKLCKPQITFFTT